MNANFGLIIRKSKADSLFIPLLQETRTWGQEVITINKQSFCFSSLQGIEFKFYPMTEFVKKHLPIDARFDDNEYMWMAGQMLDNYEEWVHTNDIDTAEFHPFETGLLELVRQAGISSILFAPEGERLENFVNINRSGITGLLRANVKNLDESKGFLATIS
ncbi:MAG: hypothetical protein K2P84_11470 [Undibacterium sp.]|nr:hypothetical protein [Undibacterium sp.]